METFIELLKSQGHKLDIADDIEVLEALATIREHWEQLRSAVTAQDVDGVITFVETLIQGPANGPLVKALDKLGEPGAKIRAALAKLGDAFQRIDKKYLVLLKPVALFDEGAAEPTNGLLEWQLVGSKKIASPAGAAATKPTYAFELGGSAKLGLEAGDSWPGTETQVADPVLRIGVGGSFEFGAKARIPFSAGALGLAGEAKREVFLDYYFDARNDDGFFATAVVQRLGRLPNPLSLESVWQAFENPDVVGAVLETNGESAFTVDVSLADAFAFKHDVKMNLGLAFKAKVRRNNTFLLRLRKIANSSNGSFDLEVALERSQARGRERAVDLGVDIDFASLGKELAKMLGEHQSKLSEVLKEYEDYLSPGTYLQTKALNAVRAKFIKDVTTDKNLQAALEDVAAHALGLSSGGGKQLEALLEAKIGEVLDGVDGVITGEIDEVAKKVGEALSKKLGIAPDLLGAVVAKAHGLVDGIRADLKSRIAALSAAKRNALMAALGKAGAAAGAAANNANNALAGVREVIGKYESAISKLKATVADAAKMKIVAKLSAQKSTGTERAVDAKIMFRRPSEAAQKIYGDIVRGDFDAIVALLQAPSDDVAVVESETVLSEQATLNRSIGFTAVLFGFELGASNIFETKSEVIIRGGRVAVITEAKFISEKNKPHEDREVSFVDAYELSAAEATREFDVALEISHEDEKLRRREIERVIGGFQSAGLLPDGTLKRAFATFESWIGPGEKNRIPADIKFALRLDGKRLERVICHDRRSQGALPAAVQREIFDKIVAELVQSGFNDEDDVPRMAELIHEALGGGSPMRPANELLFLYTRKLHLQRGGEGGNQHRAARLRRAVALRELCMTLVDAFDTMGDIYTAVPKIGAGDGWDKAQYEKAQQELNDALKGWLKAGWRDAVRPRTVAFVGTLIALAKLDAEADSGFLSLTMTKRGDEPETVVLN